MFRSAGDYGFARTKPTPQSPQPEHNIDSFVQRWKGISYNEQVILTEESITEIEKLKVHIQKGCLSGISVGGTNHNEAFHRYINTFFHRNRIGKLLAYAMMMTIISHFNNKEKGSRKAMFRPICLSSANTDDTLQEQMGILDCDRSGEDLTWIQEEDNDDMGLVSISNIVRISLQQFDMYKAMKRQTNTCTQLWKYIPYMQLLPRQLSCEDTEVEAHKRLKNNALGWNFSIIPVQPDGNCFFTAVALALVQDMEKSKSVLNHIQMDPNGSIKVLSLKLRGIVVKEWLGQHRSEYENFLSNEEDCIYENEVSKFLNDGYYK